MSADPQLAPADRVAAADWDAITEQMNELGCAPVPGILTVEECRSLSALYPQVERFRSTVDMQRVRFGSGQYRYFAHPVPELVALLREAFYPHLAAIARDWAGKLGWAAPWPDSLAEWLEICHEAGQTEPTPLMLHYEAGDWNALHRDIYGELVFPLQVVIGLDEPGADHTGGEFLLLEQRPRAQSRGTANVIRQGDALVFTTSERPVLSARGWSKGPIKHGVSVVRSGVRHTLGLVFHDAKP
jgi:hypothetical protein